MLVKSFSQWEEVCGCTQDIVSSHWITCVGDRISSGGGVDGFDSRELLVKDWFKLKEVLRLNVSNGHNAVIRCALGLVNHCLEESLWVTAAKTERNELIQGRGIDIHFGKDFQEFCSFVAFNTDHISFASGGVPIVGGGLDEFHLTAKVWNVFGLDLGFGSPVVKKNVMDMVRAGIFWQISKGIANLDNIHYILRPGIQEEECMIGFESFLDCRVSANGGQAGGGI